MALHSPHPTRRYPNVIIFLACFLLLLLVSVSLPVNKSLKWFTMTGKFSISSIASASASISFGNWGWCTSPLVASGPFGLSVSEPGECSKAKLGWTIDQTLVNILHLQSLENAVHKGLTAALVMNPIACGFAFFSWLFALWFAIHPKRWVAIVGMITACITGFLSFVAFLVDIIAYKIIKKNIEGISNDLHVTSGQTTWLTLAAWILSVIGICVFFWDSIRGGGKRGNDVELAEKDNGHYRKATTTTN